MVVHRLLALAWWCIAFWAYVPLSLVNCIGAVVMLVIALTRPKYY